MIHDLAEFDLDDDVALGAANYVAGLAQHYIDVTGHFRWAVSGGSTPVKMFEELTTRDLDWAKIDIYQVDERIVGPMNDARNLRHLQLSLVQGASRIRAMPVEETDLESACSSYGALLPAHFDLVHLGLGGDGHTASLVPGDGVLNEFDRLVALTNVYQGHRRMTLTYRALARADQLLWVVTGTDKASALEKLLHYDNDIPAGRVRAGASLIMADRLALGT